MDQPRNNNKPVTKPVTVSPTSSGGQSSNSNPRPIIHDLSEIKQAITGGLPKEKETRVLMGKDRRELNAVQFSAITSAVNSENLLPLLALLEPTEKESNTSQMILDLLEAQAEAINRMEAKLITVESKIDGLRARFPTH